jgi:hypothetical protein
MPIVPPARVAKFIQSTPSELLPALRSAEQALLDVPQEWRDAAHAEALKLIAQLVERSTERLEEEDAEARRSSYWGKAPKAKKNRIKSLDNCLLLPAYFATTADKYSTAALYARWGVQVLNVVKNGSAVECLLPTGWRIGYAYKIHRHVIFNAAGKACADFKNLEEGLCTR